MSDMISRYYAECSGCGRELAAEFRYTTCFSPHGTPLAPAYLHPDDEGRLIIPCSAPGCGGTGCVELHKAIRYRGRAA